jgi:hypothetical protein
MSLVIHKGKLRTDSKSEQSPAASPKPKPSKKTGSTRAAALSKPALQSKKLPDEDDISGIENEIAVEDLSSSYMQKLIKSGKRRQCRVRLPLCSAP